MFCLLLAVRASETGGDNTKVKNTKVVEFARSVSEEMPFPRPATLLGFWPKWREPDRMKIVGFAMRSFSGHLVLDPPKCCMEDLDKDPTFGIDTSTTTSTPQQRPPHPPASRAGSSIPNARGTTRLSGFAAPRI